MNQRFRRGYPLPVTGAVREDWFQNGTEIAVSLAYNYPPWPFFVF